MTTVYKRKPRTLPWDPRGERTSIIEGIGRFHRQEVGGYDDFGCESSAVDYSVHVEGEEESRYGVIRFRLIIDGLYRILWEREIIRGYVNEPLFEPHIVAAAQKLADDLEDTQFGTYIWDLRQYAEGELRRRKQKVDRFERSIKHLGSLLADPAQPRPWKDAKGVLNTVSKAEHAVRRAWWVKGEARAIRDLAELHAATDERMAFMEEIKRVTRPYFFKEGAWTSESILQGVRSAQFAAQNSQAA